MLAAGLAGCTSDDDTAADVTEVVIGADLASGSAVDTAYARALQLKIEQINASGALGDRQLVLRIQDNRSDPTASLRNISTFADDPSVAAVITGVCGECVVGAVKTINEKKLPTIALAPSDEVSNPVADRRFVFKLGPNSQDSNAAMVAELVRAKTKRAAILYADDDYGNGGTAALIGELTKAGIDITAKSRVKPTATEITQTVGTLADTEPDALIFLVGSDQASAAAIGAKAADFKGRVYFDAAAAGDMFIPQEAAAATDQATMVFTQILAIDDVIATTPAKAARKQWFRDYTSRYGSYSGVAAFAADAADLIADAVGKVGADRIRLRDVLETSQIDGLSGPIRLTPDNHSGLMPQALTLLVARSGRWRLQS
jgi:branched-chain amino acid transport system substrate-binding protein